MKQYKGPLRVAAYIRVSTDKNNQEDSYEMQQKGVLIELSQNPFPVFPEIPEIF